LTEVAKLAMQFSDDGQQD